MVAKCSVMIGGQLVSYRRLFGRSGPKSGSAGSSWRPQLTQISAAPQTMAPVLQDKPRHSTDLAELCSPIIWSPLFPFRACVRAKGRPLTRKGWGDPLGDLPTRVSLRRDAAMARWMASCCTAGAWGVPGDLAPEQWAEVGSFRSRRGGSLCYTY